MHFPFQTKEGENGDVPPEGVFVQIGDVEQYIVDCDQNRPPTSAPVTSRRKTGTRLISPLPIKHAVSSDDEDYETDLEYDEEGEISPGDAW